MTSVRHPAVIRGADSPLKALIAGAVLCLASCERNADPEPNEEGPPAEATASTEGIAAKIVSISGPGGVLSPALPEGTFLGAGAHAQAGQALRTPKGTLAELELDTGGRLYMNEETVLQLPGGDHAEASVLERGELVVTAGKAGDPSIVVQGGGDTVRVETGELQIRARGDARNYAVVHGRAILESGEQTIELGAGESMQTPLPEQVEAPKPELSLRPLEDTGWARTFDAAAAMADAVPRGVGSLTARRAGTQKERQALRLTDHNVTVNISGRVAHTEVEQAFFNDQGQVLEGIYRFPIPQDGSISGLSLLVGNTWMQGEVVEKQRARRIFKQIVDATVPRDPALLEWERGNVFKLRIFPIPGNGERKIRLSYTQVLPVVGGKLRYRYPLGGTGATGTPIDRFAFTVRVDGSEIAPEQLDEITTPMLALERRDQGNIVELHTERESFLPTFDLGLDVPVPVEQQQVHARSYLDQDGQAYFMVAMQPQFEMGIDERPVHYAFVLDRSHSTSPELWTTARGVVDAMTELMDEDDRFTVLACDSACEEHADGLQAPTNEAVARAQDFLNAQDLAGASDVAGALQQASSTLDRGGNAQRVVVYLGDGVPTSGEMAPDGITDLLREPLADTRVLAVALGARADLTALQAVVDVTGGDLVQADARDDLRSLVRELRLRAEVPALRDAELDLPEGMVLARMQNVSAIRPGDTVLVAGKLHHPVRGDIVLRGRGPKGQVSTSFPIELSAARDGSNPVDAHLPRTWAQLQIQHLTKTQGFRAKDEIIALSKDYTVLSRHTALLVLENDAMFREFNVVRKANKTDKWKGDLKSEASVIEQPRDGIESSNEKQQGRTQLKKEASRAGGTVAPSSGLIGGADGHASSSPDAAAPARNAPAPAAPAPVAPALDPAPEPEPEPVEELEEDEAGDEAATESGRFGERAKNTEHGDADLDDVVTSDDEDLADGEAAPDANASSGFGKGFGRGGGGHGAGPARDDAKSTKSKKKPRAPHKPDTKPRENVPQSEPWGGGSGGVVEPWQRENRRSSRRRWRSAPRLKIRSFPTLSSRSREKVASLSAAVQRDPIDRAAHSRLVRTAMAVGHADTLKFAQAWALVDPDHAGALEALADALAKDGSPVALRAYESIVEVKPFSKDEHASLARAYENDGDFDRACSHRRALVSIDPDNANHQVGLISCLTASGRTVQASRARLAATTRLPKQAEWISSAISLPVSLSAGRGQLRATLSWSTTDDLDIAFIDRKGRRLSTMHSLRGVSAAESPRGEELVLSKVRGSVFVEVSRHGDGETSAPIAATLTLKTPHGRRTIPITIGAGSQRVAKVFWTR